MNRTWTIIIVKFMIATALILSYVFVMSVYIAPFLVQQVFGQSAFDAPSQYGQQQFAQPYQQPFDQQFQQPYDQYQQPYQQYGQQYGTQSYQPYGMQPQYGMPPQQQFGSTNTVLGFGIQEIVAALIAGGGATAYARRRTNSLEADKQLMMGEMLKDKQRLAELARVSYNKMPQKGYEINDAPSIQLKTMNEDIDKFADETAKA